MAQSSHQPEPQPQPQPQPQLHSQTILEIPFSLAPSIFTSFAALSNEPLPHSPEEKTRRILRNLDTQHAAVRRNMVGLLRIRGKILVERAEEELAGLEGESEDDDREEGNDEARKEKQEEIRKSREEMLRRVRVKAREGAKAEDYEIKVGNAEFEGMSNADISGDRDVVMGGMGVSPTATRIRKGLSLELRDLVDRGVGELEAYDNHAAETTSMYKQTIERRKVRPGSASTAAVQSPVATSTTLRGRGGILRNGHEQSPLDMTAIGRMSAGMPVATTFDRSGEITGRGSANK